MTATAYSSPRRFDFLGIGVTAAALALLVVASSGCSGESERAINVVIHFPGPAQTLSRAELLVDYSHSGARLAGGNRPACTVLLPLVDADFTDDGKGKLHIVVRSPHGFSPPVDLVACRMLASGPNTDPARVQTRLKIDVHSATRLYGGDLNEKQLSGLSSRIRTRSSATELSTHTGGGRHKRLPGADSTSGRQSSGAARTGLSDSVSSSRLGDNRPERGKGRADFARPLDRIEDSRIALPPTESESRGGGGHAYQASPNLPNILSTGEQAPGDNSNASGQADGGTSGAVDTAEPSIALPTHDYEITISVLSTSGDLGALQVLVDFMGSSGGFVGRGSSVSCTSLAAGAMAAFNRENQGTKAIKAGFIAMNGLATPGPVASCRFKSRENVTAQSFSVKIEDASDTDSKVLVPPPFVAISDVRLLN